MRKFTSATIGTASMHTASNCDTVSRGRNSPRPAHEREQLERDHADEGDVRLQHARQVRASAAPMRCTSPRCAGCAPQGGVVMRSCTSASSRSWRGSKPRALTIARVQPTSARCLQQDEARRGVERLEPAAVHARSGRRRAKPQRRSASRSRRRSAGARRPSRYRTSASSSTLRSIQPVAMHRSAGFVHRDGGSGHGARAAARAAHAFLANL